MEVAIIAVTLCICLSTAYVLCAYFEHKERMRELDNKKQIGMTAMDNLKPKNKTND